MRKKSSKHKLTLSERGSVYMGCEAPVPFALRFKALCTVAGIKKRQVICESIQAFIVKREGKLNAKQSIAYDRMLESYANMHDLSVNELKRDLDFTFGSDAGFYAFLKKTARKSKTAKGMN